MYWMDVILGRSTIEVVDRFRPSSITVRVWLTNFFFPPFLGIFSFGYVVEGADFLSDIKEGDVIVSAKVTEGLENLVQPKN